MYCKICITYLRNSTRQASWWLGLHIWLPKGQLHSSVDLLPWGRAAVTESTQDARVYTHTTPLQTARPWHLSSPGSGNALQRCLCMQGKCPDNQSLEVLRNISSKHEKIHRIHYSSEKVLSFDKLRPLPPFHLGTLSLESTFPRSCWAVPSHLTSPHVSAQGRKEKCRRSVCLVVAAALGVGGSRPRPDRHPVLQRVVTGTFPCVSLHCDGSWATPSKQLLAIKPLLRSLGLLLLCSRPTHHVRFCLLALIPCESRETTGYRCHAGLVCVSHGEPKCA